MPASDSRPDTPTSLRLPRDVLERADRVAARIAEGVGLASGHVASRHAILVGALLDGLARLERRHGCGARGRAPRRPRG